MESFIPQPPTEPCPDYLPKRRPGVRYVRRASLPPLQSQDPVVSGISKRTKSSGAFPQERPTTSTAAASNPARHTAKSRARAAFLEGERAKFDEMFPPLTKAAAVQPGSQDRQPKDRVPSREASSQSLKREESISSVKSASSTTNSMKLRTLSYSEVTRGVPGGAKHTTQQVPATPEQEPFQGTALSSHQPGVPRQRSYSEAVQEKPVPMAQQEEAPRQQCPPVALPHPQVVQQQPHPETVNQQPRPAMVQRLHHPETVHHEPHPEMVHQLPHPQTVQQQPHPHMLQQQPHPGAVYQQPHPGMVQPQSHPQTANPQPHPKTLQRYPHPVVMLPMHPMMPIAARMTQPIPASMAHNLSCSPVVQQQHCHPGVVPKPYCTPVVMHQWYPGMVQHHQYSPTVALQQQCHPGKARQKRRPTEDFETLLARRKEEYARIYAEKEKFTKVLEELRRTVAKNQAFIDKHPEQAARVTFRKSVAVEDAYEAERKGDQKKEFEILQSHLNDLSFNKAQVVAQLENDEREKESPEKQLLDEVEKLNDNDEAIIEQTMEIVRGMLNKAATSDEDDDEESEESEEESEQTDEDDDEDSEDNEDSDAEDTGVPAMSSVQNLSPADNFPDEGTAFADTAPEDSDQEEISCSEQEEVSENDDAVPPQKILKKLDEIAGGIEDDVLENMAKFGRLMQMETVHSGKSNNALLDMLTTLLGAIETEHEANQEDDSCSDDTSDAESSSEGEESAEEDEQTEPVDPQVHFTAEATSADEDDENSGPIMPAFTSTSINVSSNNSQTPLEGMEDEEPEQADTLAQDAKNTAAAMDKEEEDTGSILPAFTSTSINLSSNSSNAPIEGIPSVESELGCSEPSHKLEGENDPNSSAGDMELPQNKLKDDKKFGKKHVSFASHGQNEKPQKRCTSIYARMSATDVGELVSSALVSDIMSYADPNSGTCHFEDECTLSSGTDEQPVIAVKYISVVTTEKNKTTLRPVFAGGSDTKNTLSFTIKGEILLSTPPTDSDLGLSAASTSNTREETPRMRPTTASTRQTVASDRQEERTWSHGEAKRTTADRHRAAGETPRSFAEESRLTECEVTDSSHVRTTDEGFSNEQENEQAVCQTSSKCERTDSVCETTAGASKSGQDTQKMCDENLASCNIDNATGEESFRTLENGQDTAKMSATGDECEYTDSSQICKVTEGSSEAQESEKDTAKVSATGNACELTDSLHVCNVAEVSSEEEDDLSQEAGADKCGQQLQAAAGAVLESSEAANTPGEAAPTSSSITTECGTQAEGGNKASGTQKTGENSDAQATNPLVENNGLRLEINLSALLSARHPQLVPQLAIEYPSNAIHQQLAPQLAIEYSPNAIHQQLVPQLAIEYSPIGQNTSEKSVSPPGEAENNEKPSVGKDECDPGKEDGVTTSEATPKEKAPAPYVYRLVTPSIFSMPPNLVMDKVCSEDLAPTTVSAEGPNLENNAEKACKTTTPDTTDEYGCGVTSSPNVSGGVKGDDTKNETAAEIADNTVNDSGAESTADQERPSENYGPLHAVTEDVMAPSVGGGSETRPPSELEKEARGTPEPAIPATEDVNVGGPENTAEQEVAKSADNEDTATAESTTLHTHCETEIQLTSEQDREETSTVAKQDEVCEDVIASGLSGTETTEQTEAETSSPECKEDTASSEGNPASAESPADHTDCETKPDQGDFTAVEEDEPIKDVTHSGVRIDTPGNKAEQEVVVVDETSNPTAKENTSANAMPLTEPTHEGMATQTPSELEKGKDTPEPEQGEDTAEMTHRSDEWRDRTNQDNKDSIRSEESTTFFSKVRKSLASFRRCDLQEAVVPPYKQSADEKLKLRQTQSGPAAIPVEPPREPLLPRRAKMNRMYRGPMKAKPMKSGPLKANSQAIMQQPSHLSLPKKNEAVEEEGMMGSNRFRSRSSPITPNMRDERYSYASVTRGRSLQPVTVEPERNEVAVGRAGSSSKLTPVNTTAEPFTLEPLNETKADTLTITQQLSKKSERGLMGSKSFRSHSSLTALNRKDELNSHASVIQGKDCQPTAIEPEGNQNLDTISGFDRGTTMNTADPFTSEPLSKPKSLPGTLNQSGNRLSRRMRKSHSEKLSAVPKLPKL